MSNIPHHTLTEYPDGGPEPRRYSILDRVRLPDGRESTVMRVNGGGVVVYDPDRSTWPVWTRLTFAPEELTLIEAHNAAAYEPPF